MRRWFGIAFTCVAVAGSMTAARPVQDGWATPIGQGRTAVDAARQVFPGGTLVDGQFVLAHDKQLRMPGTSKTRAMLPQETHLEAPTSRLVRAQGRRHVLLFWEGTRPEASENGGFGEEVAVLAVIPEGTAEVTDVAEVKQDRLTFLGGEALPPLGPDDAFTVVNTHLNAGEEFIVTSLFHVRGSRLRPIAELFLFSEVGGCQDTFQTALSWKTKSLAGRDYPDVLAMVDLVHSPKGYNDGCDPPLAKERRETFQDVYRWDAVQAQYVRASGNIDRLAKWLDTHR